MPNSSPSTPTIGVSSSKPVRVSDSIMTQLGDLLVKALADATSLEVRTFTSEAGDTALATTDDPLVDNTRLRAFSRIAMDGDTQQCIPLRASGEPDEALWTLHCEAVDQARRDRAASVDAAISALEQLAGK